MKSSRSVLRSEENLQASRLGLSKSMSFEENGNKRASLKSLFPHLAKKNLSFSNEGLPLLYDYAHLHIL